MFDNEQRSSQWDCEREKIQLTPQVGHQQHWLCLSRGDFFFVLRNIYFLFPNWVALQKILPNSPCDLFAIRFVCFFYSHFFSQQQQPITAPWTIAKQTIWLCTCVFVHQCVEVHPHSCAHFPVRWPGFSRGLPENYTFVRTSFHLSAACRTSRHLTHSSSPARSRHWHSYSSTTMWNRNAPAAQFFFFFWKAISFLTPAQELLSNGLLSLCESPPETHSAPTLGGPLWPQTADPFKTGPNAPLNRAARLL